MIHKGKGKGKGYGKGKGKGKGKGYSKGKGKGKGYDITAYQTIDYSAQQPPFGQCLAKGCQSKSGHYRYCTEHYKQGMEQGYLISYNDYRQTFDNDRNRDNKRQRKGKGKGKGKGKNNYGFSKENMQGMAAVADHLNSHVATLLDKRLGVAHNVEAFQNDQPAQNQNKRSLWDDMRIKDGKIAEAHRAKKIKTHGFLDNLAQYSEQ